MARWLRRGGESELSTGEEERQRGRVKASAAASADEGGRVGADAGRLRREAASTAHGRHVAGLLCHGRDAARRVSGRASAEAGQARRWAGPRRGARCGGRLAGLASVVGRKRGGGPRLRKALFHFYFQELFKCQLSNIILSKEMTSFENGPKIKVA